MDNPLICVSHEFSAVGGYDHRGTPQVYASEEDHDIPGYIGIKIACGLVGKKDEGIIDNGPGYRYPLLFSSGKLKGIGLLFF